MFTVSSLYPYFYIDVGILKYRQGTAFNWFPSYSICFSWPYVAGFVYILVVSVYIYK